MTTLEDLKDKNMEKESVLGKFEGCYNATLAEALLNCIGESGEDESFGDVENIGHHALIKLDDLNIKEDGHLVYGVIVSENSQGFFIYETFENEETLSKAWDELKESLREEPIEWYPTEDEYEEQLNECYPEIKIGNFTFMPGKILRELDEVAFNCGMSEAMMFECPLCQARYDDSDEAKLCCQDW